jgi:hypothetical protein
MIIKSLRRTGLYDSLLGISGALYLDVFEQPEKTLFSSILLHSHSATCLGYGMKLERNLKTPYVEENTSSFEIPYSTFDIRFFYLALRACTVSARASSPPTLPGKTT